MTLYKLPLLFYTRALYLILFFRSFIYLTLPYLTLPSTTVPHLTLPYLALYHRASPYLTFLTSPHLILPCLIFSSLKLRYFYSLCLICSSLTSPSQDLKDLFMQAGGKKKTTTAGTKLVLSLEGFEEFLDLLGERILGQDSGVAMLS
jgi:hypothetical protein